MALFCVVVMLELIGALHFTNVCLLKSDFCLIALQEKAGFMDVHEMAFLVEVLLTQKYTHQKPLCVFEDFFNLYSLTLMNSSES